MQHNLQLVPLPKSVRWNLSLLFTCLLEIIVHYRSTNFIWLGCVASVFVCVYAVGVCGLIIDALGVLGGDWAIVINYNWKICFVIVLVNCMSSLFCVSLCFVLFCFVLFCFVFHGVWICVFGAFACFFLQVTKHHMVWLEWR